MRSVCRRASDSSVATRTLSAVRPLRSPFEPTFVASNDGVTVNRAWPSSVPMISSLLAPAVAGHPLRVAVGGVDEVAPRRPCVLRRAPRTTRNGGPPEHVEAQAERVHSEIRPGDVAHASNLPGA